MLVYETLISLMLITLLVYTQGGRDYWALYYNSRKSSYFLAQQLWGLLLNFDWLVH